MRSFALPVVILFLFIHSAAAQNIWSVDTHDEWTAFTGAAYQAAVMRPVEAGGSFDLMGSGALLLSKGVPDSLFALNSEFKQSGTWTSAWIENPGGAELTRITTDIIAYGNPVDFSRGWRKFEGNPVISGSNTLLPLREENITEQTILLPEPPGGVPQDQSIVRGAGQWEGKWLLLFNHTPHKWPYEYYWSYVETESLEPLKRGVNPFRVPPEHYPLFGPIDNQAPNDWIEVGGRWYAPDETWQSGSHLWVSDDFLTWRDLGEITNKTGHDPGIVFDGTRFHLFNENESKISHCFLDPATVTASGNKDVLDVGDHTGDADVSFFNNQWHMFIDDGQHLFYKISYAAASPDDFPYGWELTPEIYGPHKPEQRQRWDDDDEGGNRFGTGDADIALEGETVYLFTERPVGAAWRELDEIYNGAALSVRCHIEIDNDLDGEPDGQSDWIELQTGEREQLITEYLAGLRFRLVIELETMEPAVSPLIRSVSLRVR